MWVFGQDGPDEEQSRGDLHAGGERGGADEPGQRVEDLEQRDGLRGLDQGEKRVVEAMQLVVRDERGDQEDGAAEDRRPQAEGEGVVREEVG